MCGIAGVIGKRNPQPVGEYLEIFGKTMRHRGPDDSGFHSDAFRAFLNLRLAILDIAGGHQPIYSEDKTIGIVYNGEIYNFATLKDDLVQKGYTFKTHSDTEVIVKAYEVYGADAFAMLNGMFAFCIWDDRKNTIYLVRDRFGIKPLYIYEDGERFIFSSELKGIVGIPGIDLSLDSAGFQDYLTFRYIPAPFTFFRNIRRLDAGTYLTIKNGISAQYRYWDADYRDPYPLPDLNDVKEELMRKMLKAVTSQLMGEVPIGVLLSGGIDSSTIAYFIHQAGAKLTTFNIGFPEVNEFEFSRAVARKYGLKHIEVVTTAEELARDFNRITVALDEPIADPACLPLFRLCEDLKRHVTVVLSGEGGDEVFGGYTQYHHMMTSNIPYHVRFQEFMDRSWYFSNALDFMNDPFIPPHTLRFRKYFEEQPQLNGMLAYDMKTWMPENLMMKADKILMAHSLEGRFPFLDKELFDYVAGLPQGYKLHPRGTTKWLLKEAMSPYLPKVIIDRQKMGFTVPVDRLLDLLKSLIVDVFESLPRTGLAEVLNARLLRKHVEMYYQHRRILPLQLWTLFVMCYWHLHALPAYQAARDVISAQE